jgi:GT2 family glycosyltransferase
VSDPTIAVVMVNWNSRDDVLSAVRSLRRPGEGDLPVVVVDNGSTDGSAEALRAAFPDVRVIEAGANLGFAEGCNRGIEATRSDWVLLLNNDAVAEPGCLEELRRAAGQAPPDVGMVQPLVLFADRPSRVNSTGIRIRNSGRAADRHFDKPLAAAEGAGDPFSATAGAALFRRSMLEEVRLGTGYLDRDYFMYFEDVDLGWRCRLAGYRAVYVPRARVLHRHQGSAKRRGKSFAMTQVRVNRIVTLLHNASWAFILRTLLYTLRDVLKVLLQNGPGPLLRLRRRLPAILRDRERVAGFTRVDPRALERTWFRRRG